MWMKDIREKLIQSSVKPSEVPFSPNTTNTSFNPPPELSDSDKAFFADPELHTFLDNVDKYGAAIKDMLMNIPPFEPYAQINKRIEEAINAAIPKKSAVTIDKLSKDDKCRSADDLQKGKTVYNDVEVSPKASALDELVDAAVELSKEDKSRSDEDLEKEKKCYNDDGDGKKKRDVQEAVVETIDEAIQCDDFACEPTFDFWLEKDAGIKGLSPTCSTPLNKENSVNVDSECDLPGLDRLVNDFCTGVLIEKLRSPCKEKEKSAIDSCVQVELTRMDESGNGGSINFVPVKSATPSEGLCTQTLGNEEVCKDVGAEEVCKDIGTEDVGTDEICEDVGCKDAASKDVGVSISGVDKSVGTSYLLHSDSYASTMCVVPSHLGCTIDCGLVSPSMTLRSESMLKMKDTVREMLSLRKQVADYSLLHGSPSFEL